MRYVVLVVLLASIVHASCYSPGDGELINASVMFCSDTFDALNGITISGRDFVVDCNTAVIRGIKGQSNNGLIIKDARNVTVTDCNVVTFENGMLLENVSKSMIVGNNLLKNSVGIRLFDSFENVLDNNDKSLVKGVSAINARYNAVVVGNKGVEEGFCDVNACNSRELPDACVEDDFCYGACDDPDCVQPVVEVNRTPVKSAEEIIAEFEEEVRRDVPEQQFEQPAPQSTALPVYVKVLMYFAAYLLTFVLIQLFIKKR